MYLFSNTIYTSLQLDCQSNSLIAEFIILYTFLQKILLSSFHLTCNVYVMVGKKNSIIVENSQILLYNDIMINILLGFLKKVYDDDKRNDIRFNFNAWI